MKIVLFSASYVPVVGGLQTVVHNLAKHLMARGHDVRVVTNRYPIVLPRQETIDGVPVDRMLFLKPSVDQLQRHRPDLFAASFYFGPQSKRQLSALMKEFQPDVINVHFPNESSAILLQLRQQIVFRLVVSLHGHDVYQFNSENGGSNGLHAKADVLRRLLKSADAVTAVSGDLLGCAKSLDDAVSEKARVIPNGVDVDRFSQAAAYKHRRPYVLGAGRLVRSKGFDLLIDAFAEARLKEMPDLIIAGTGDELEALQQQVSVLKLEDRVLFFGAASSEEVAALMKGSAAVVVPSRTESFGLTALEALAAQKPLVTTNVGGLKELISAFSGNGHGLHARIAEVNPTCDSIAAGLEQVSERVNCEAEQSHDIPPQFHWESVAAAYERVLIPQ